MSGLTSERLREVLHYDPDTGLFRWRVTRPRAAIGSQAGTLDTHGYVRIGVDGAIHRGHRLAWFYMTGEWPSKEVDHLDGRKSNNAFSNLRDVARNVNQQNVRAPHKRGGSGALGVSFHHATGKWRARVWTNGKNTSLGLYDNREAAHSKYVEAKRQLHEGNTL